MRTLCLVSLLIIGLALPQAAGPALRQAPRFRWMPLASGVEARLRGISAISDRVVWASGANGTVIRTGDGGVTWHRLTVPGAEKLDFRDIDAVDDNTAFLLSIGPGESSRIYKTTDAGVTWREQFVNRDPDAFFDAMDFWDASHGIAFSDSVKGQFVVLATNDGGKTWTRVPAADLPSALPDEGAFAASGTNIDTIAPNHAWIGTGGGTQSRVLRSNDRGRTWRIAATPLAAGPSAGIFSIAFSSARNGIIVGGDFKVESGAVDNAALTSDGGATWTLVKGLSGFRSVVAYLSADGRTVLAVGPSGSDLSADSGKTWDALEGPGFHTFSIAKGGTVGFGAGERGAVWKLVKR
jgi:photosystem II stability/assembly factor-like uncharacterized protein